MSADGRTISFLTDATNLDPHCPGTGSNQMFVRDLDRRVNTCASVGENGRGTSSVFGMGSLSRDGNLVTFMSTGPIIAADGNGVIADMFVRDIRYEVTTIASTATVEPDADVQSPDLSTDGRYLVFASDATNLVPDDANGVQDIFRRDQQTGEVTFVNVSTLFGLGLPPNGDSRNPSISGDGNIVAFTSDATNYAVDANGAADVFVRNISAGTTTRVSVSSAFAAANGASTAPAISANGRFVAFASTATNLDPNCTGAMKSVYVRDLLLNTTTCVAPLLGGFRQQVEGVGPSISADGRYVALRAGNLGVSPCGSPDWIFVWDRVTAIADCVAPGLVADIAASGRSVAFTSTDPTLDAPCTIGMHVYVAELPSNAITCVSTTDTNLQGNQPSSSPSISADGRYVAFVTDATNLLYPDSDTNAESDVVVHDRTLNWTTAASRNRDFDGGNDWSGTPAIAPDGALVAFESQASDLVDGDTAGHLDVFVRAAQALHLEGNVPIVVPRGVNFIMTLHGLGFQPDSVVSAGEGVTVSNPIYLGPSTFRITLSAAPDATPGARDLSIANLGPAWNTAADHARSMRVRHGHVRRSPGRCVSGSGRDPLGSVGRPSARRSGRRGCAGSRCR